MFGASSSRPEEQCKTRTHGTVPGAIRKRGKLWPCRFYSGDGGMAGHTVLVAESA